MRTTFRLMAAAILAGSFFGVILAQTELVKIERIDPEEVKFAGFVLDSEQDVQIEAVGTHHRSRNYMTTSAWILNADNRELVWELTDANSKWLERRLRQYKDTVRLPKGRYEVYYANFPSWEWHDGWSFTNFFFGRDRDDDREYELSEDFYVTVTANGKKLSTQEVIDYQETLKKQAVVNLTTSREEEYLKQGFELSKATDLVVYCLGEARDGTFDYGWIINADTRRQVWRFDDRDSDYAGGAEKNRYMKETINLPAGRYAAFFVTDDSHTPRDWNSPPPHDPAFWGLSIFTEKDSDRNNVKLYNYEDIPAKNVIVELNKLRDDAYVSKGFSLKKDMKVRVYAIGEGSGGDMYDYGWITDATNHERVWEMNYRNTDHAGGNSKNRLSDEVIDLKKGNYMVHFVTDGSHSWRDWNASPPFDQEAWGITIIAADDDFKSSDIGEYREEMDKSILARIVGVGDWENRKERFSLNKDSNIRVYAIGEGRSGEMFDYAWIEDAKSGKVVWEMTYRNTDYAGGARKNREFNDTVFLRSGDYVLHYESDDSHSFRDWNSAPPRDPVNYGVTIYNIEN